MMAIDFNALPRGLHELGRSGFHSCGRVAPSKSCVALKNIAAHEETFQRAIVGFQGHHHRREETMTRAHCIGSAGGHLTRCSCSAMIMRQAWFARSRRMDEIELMLSCNNNNQRRRSRSRHCDCNNSGPASEGKGALRRLFEKSGFEEAAPRRPVRCVAELSSRPICPVTSGLVACKLLREAKFPSPSRWS